MTLLTCVISLTNVCVMKLSDWLAQENMSQRAFGETIGLTQGRISQICRHGSRDMITAMAIVNQTEGAVSLEDLAPIAETAE